MVERNEMRIRLTVFPSLFEDAVQAVAELNMHDRLRNVDQRRTGKLNAPGKVDVLPRGARKLLVEATNPLKKLSPYTHVAGRCDRQEPKIADMSGTGTGLSGWYPRFCHGVIKCVFVELANDKLGVSKRSFHRCDPSGVNLVVIVAEQQQRTVRMCRPHISSVRWPSPLIRGDDDDVPTVTEPGNIKWEYLVRSVVGQHQFPGTGEVLARERRELSSEGWPTDCRHDHADLEGIARITRHGTRIYRRTAHLARRKRLEGPDTNVVVHGW